MWVSLCTEHEDCSIEMEAEMTRQSFTSILNSFIIHLYFCSWSVRTDGLRELNRRSAELRCRIQTGERKASVISVNITLSLHCSSVTEAADVNCGNISAVTRRFTCIWYKQQSLWVRLSTTTALLKACRVRDTTLRKCNTKRKQS
jgi:hypothetical protein